MATVEFKKVEQGEAYNFRKVINDNFSKTAEVINDLDEQIEEATQKIKEDAISIIMSDDNEKPTTQKAGDFWFKIL